VIDAPGVELLPVVNCGVKTKPTNLPSEPENCGLDAAQQEGVAETLAGRVAGEEAAVGLDQRAEVELVLAVARLDAEASVAGGDGGRPSLALASASSF